MAIAPTGAIYKSLIFDGEDSRDYGIYITGEAVYNAPQRAVEMISIPNRNGAFALDKGYFENIEVTYPAGIFADNETNFAEAISDFRNFLCSRKGYVRLSDEYNPGEYRMAVYKSGLEVSPTQLRAGEFEITFDCKPQRFLTSGEDEITIGQWGETKTVSGSIATFEGNGATGIKSLTANIEPIQPNSYSSVWVGGAGKNKLENTATTTTKQGLTYTVNADGTVNVSGTATANSYLNISTSLTFSEAVVVNGVPTPVTSGVYMQTVAGGTNYNDNNGGGVTIPANTTITEVRMRINNGVTVNNVVFKPMIRLSSVSDATYEPYENICPISGHTDVVVSRTGINIWDEEWENKKGYSTGAMLDNNSNIASKNFISVVSNTDYYLKLPSGVLVYIYGYDADKNFVRLLTLSNGVFNTKEAVFVKFATRNDTISTYNNDISINYPSTDTSYHAYEGDTYTIDLDGTRYGGTLDATSGLLTVTHAIVTIDGTAVTVTNNGQTAYSTRAFFTPSPTKANGTSNMISDKFAQYTGTDASGVVNGRAGSGGVEFFLPPTVANTSAAVNAWFASNNTQLCYELATPTTVQLTAQQLSAISGINNVWADSGDVTVQYGNAPNMIYNPTLFDAKPLLEVEGYGNINIGDDTITLNDVAMGEIAVHDSVNKSVSYSANPASYTFTFDDTDINSGDTITIPWVHCVFKTAPKSGYTPTSCTITSTTSATGYCNSSGKTKRVRIEDASFTYGTASTVSGSALFSQSYKVSGNSHTVNETITLAIFYALPNQLTYRIDIGSLPTCFNSLSKEVSSWKVIADSTKSALGHPTYIDLDIGEAYLISNGVPVSLNNVASLPNELPVLKPDGTEITYDNTVTDLKVVPHWWKV